MIKANRIAQQLAALLLLLMLMSWHAGVAAAAPSCTGETLISETFSNGARWQMCWDSHIRENLVLSEVYYTPPDGTEQRVLSSARLAQLHVAYDDGDITYSDITQYGLGGDYRITLEEADCPDGQLLKAQTRNAVCVQRSVGADHYRTASGVTRAESLSLYSVSQVGAYAYIISWNFYSNGSIQPQIGATGALQRSSEQVELPFGRVLSGDATTLWLSHTHNYYWRLDFDLGDNTDDDVVFESSTHSLADGKRITEHERFTTEQARVAERQLATAWTILDNPASALPSATDKGYRIEPLHYGHRLERAGIEPYTEFDFYLTVANDCERFASQNARYNPDCLNDVLEFVNDESLTNQDVVVWHRVSFHHVPRNEDQKQMHSHWDGFVIEPVNIHLREQEQANNGQNQTSSTPKKSSGAISVWSLLALALLFVQSIQRLKSGVFLAFGVKARLTSRPLGRKR